MVSSFPSIGNALTSLKAVVAGAALLALAACDGLPAIDGAALGVGGGSGGSVDVALLVPNGSGVPELDVIARDLENAARLAANDVSGATITITSYATRRDTNTAVSAARQAVADGADIILGPLDGDIAAAVGLALRDTGANVLSFSNNTAIAGGNVYLLGQTFADSARRVASYAANEGKERVVIVHANTVAGEAGRAAAANAVRDAGITLAGSAAYENTLPGISAATGSIRQAVSASGADTVFLTSSSAGALPILADLLPEAGVRPGEVQYLGLGRWDSDPRLFTLNGIQGGWFAMPDRSRLAAFDNRFSSAYGSTPHPLAFTAYDGIAIIGALVAQGGANPLSGQSLTRSSGFQGSTGVVRLRVDGTNERGLAVGSIQAGQVVTLSPAPRGFGGFGS